MRLKKILMLFIFIFSLMMTNLFNSHNKPPLLENRATQNIVILAENNSNPQEIIPLDLSGDNHNFIVDYYKDMIPLLIEMVLTVLTIYVVKEKFFRYRKERGLAGIILWDKKRVLRN